MDLFYDNDSIAEIEVLESINEATGKPEKTYKISGIFSTIGKRNRNGRVYPRAIWESQVKEYQDKITSGSINCLMEYEHPPRSSVDPIKAVAKINKLEIKGDHVIGEATLLNNAVANQLKTLIDNGIKISVSSRGVGSVKNGIVENFKLVTYDIVAEPSDYNATMSGIVEGYEQDLSNLEQKREAILRDFDNMLDYFK